MRMRSELWLQLISQLCAVDKILLLVCDCGRVARGASRARQPMAGKIYGNARNCVNAGGDLVVH